MPATPSWPPQSTPRLFVEEELYDGQELCLQGGEAHYLLNVMRLKEGAPLKLFDGKTGEWLGEVSMVAKRDLIVRVAARLREREDVPDVWLLAAPIKKVRLDMMIEKACELGVARFQPIVTRRTIIERLKLDRLRANMIEAAEQCGRTAIPVLEEPTKLNTLLKNWPADRTLYFADENGGAPALPCFAKGGPRAAILIGPEGGFEDGERAAIRACPRAVSVSLGPRILRAETAGIAALSLWMAGAGDWK